MGSGLRAPSLALGGRSGSSLINISEVMLRTLRDGMLRMLLEGLLLALPAPPPAYDVVTRETSVLRESQFRGAGVCCVSSECLPSRLRLFPVTSLSAPLVLLLCALNSESAGMASMESSAWVGSSFGGRGSALAEVESS